MKITDVQIIPVEPNYKSSWKASAKVLIDDKIWIGGIMIHQKNGLHVYSENLKFEDRQTQKYFTEMILQYYALKEAEQKG